MVKNNKFVKTILAAYIISISIFTLLTITLVGNQYHKYIVIVLGLLMATFPFVGIILDDFYIDNSQQQKKG